MNNIGNYKIKPSARIIKTIGDNLIKDTFAAIVELVKNSYDSDASEVKIEFTNEEKDGKEILLKIRILDDGHGMSLDTVVNKWMVPATNDKYRRAFSPKGRVLQGRKGIGRYASALLGEELRLETVDIKGEETFVEIDWREFDKDEYLENIKIPIKSRKTEQKSKTIIEITGSTEKVFDWTKESIDLLINELSKLVSPLNDIFDLDGQRKCDKFAITLIFKDFFVEEYENESIKIEPIELIDFYDYRLYGAIGKNNQFDLTFINNVTGIEQVEKIKVFAKKIEEGISVGNIKIDFRVFDRDPDSIETLISRGVKNKTTGEYLGKNETRKYLDSMSGIGVYRGGFKVRPYGDSGYDWLELDRLRVQSPGRKIGSNQIIGFIEIESEEQSSLIEKSARDGLKENAYYKSFIELLRIAINELETRRFMIRKVTGRGRSKTELGKQINNLFDLENLEKKIENLLSESNIDKNQIDIVKLHFKEEEQKKAKQLRKIEEIVAIYQGQATLGRVMMIVMHESKKPLKWFKNQSKLLGKYIDRYKENNDIDALFKIENSSKKYEEQTEILANLFKKLDLLAVNKSKKKSDFNISDVIKDSIDIFSSQIQQSGIKIEIKGNEKLQYYGYKSDFIAIFANLIENSIYWIDKANKEEKYIRIKIKGDKSLEYIDFVDNGFGIKQEFIKSKIIFEPEFTTKYDAKGSGLGLAIAGEAAERNNSKLSAIYIENGTYFRLNVKETGEE